MEIKKIDLASVALSSTAIGAIAFASRYLLGAETDLTVIILCNAIVLLYLLEAYRRTQKNIERVLNENNKLSARSDKLLANQYKQIESLFSIFKFVDLSYPLPHTRGWAASPDFLKQVIEIVLRNQPKVVVEASSGVSTIIIGYCLKKIGCGSVISFEHEEKYAEVTRQLVDLHGLQDVVKVVHAPLTSIDIHGEQYDWYDVSKFELENVEVDLLVVDGPPGASKALARYPAVPVMYDYLGQHAKVIIDDGKRNDEKEIARRWQEESGLDCDFLDLEKGAFLFSKK